MAGFVIAFLTAVLPFVLGALGLGRTRMLVIGGVLALAWVASMASADRVGEEPPLWYGIGLVLLLYGIWCGGLWLGVWLRRIRRAAPG
jgi:hypothetical protein